MRIAGLIKMTWYLTNHKIFSQLSSVRIVKSCTSPKGNAAGIVPKDSLRTNLFIVIRVYKKLKHSVQITFMNTQTPAQHINIPGRLIINGLCTSPHIWLCFSRWYKNPAVLSNTWGKKTIPRPDVLLHLFLTARLSSSKILRKILSFLKYYVLLQYFRKQELGTNFWGCYFLIIKLLSAGILKAITPLPVPDRPRL